MVAGSSAVSRLCPLWDDSSSETTAAVGDRWLDLDQVDGWIKRTVNGCRIGAGSMVVSTGDDSSCGIDGWIKRRVNGWIDCSPLWERLVAKRKWQFFA